MSAAIVDTASSDSLPTIQRRSHSNLDQCLFHNDGKSPAQRNHQSTKFQYQGLQSFPHEVLRSIIKFTVVDNLPIVDPVGDTAFCSYFNHNHRSHASFQEVGETTGRRNGEKALADSSIRDANKMNPNEGVFRAGICPNILVANKLCNNIGTPYLYESNTLLFTNVEALDCFVEHFETGRFRRVQILVDITQIDATHQCHLSRLAAVQRYRNRPWLSWAMDGCSWWNNGSTVLCLFPWLKSVEIRVSGWIQRQAINVNGTPYALGTVAQDANGMQYTVTPTTRQLDLKVDSTEPIQIVRGFKPLERLTEMISAGWAAENFRLTGCEEAEGYEELQQQLSDLSDAVSRISVIKVVPKREQAKFEDILEFSWQHELPLRLKMGEGSLLDVMHVK